MIANMLALLLATAIFLGLAQDVARINSLRAGDSPPVKIITKYEAWNAVYYRRYR